MCIDNNIYYIQTNIYTVFNGKDVLLHQTLHVPRAVSSCIMQHTLTSLSASSTITRHTSWH